MERLLLLMDLFRASDPEAVLDSDGILVGIRVTIQVQPAVGEDGEPILDLRNPWARTG